MTKLNIELTKIKDIPTPFYYYDLSLLRDTLQEVMANIKDDSFVVHYALKANPNAAILKEMKEAGFGADCVSGGEIIAAIESGISPDKIVFAGVGKADWEIDLALDKDIFCFNVESIQEIEIINELAGEKNKCARIALRINPNVDAKTHHYITTGLDDNKFGLNTADIDKIMDLLPSLKHIRLIGLHFHIGSQVTDINVYEKLCKRINDIQADLNSRQIYFEHINVGGGLGVNYEEPEKHQIPDFKGYFDVFRKHLNIQPEQSIHFELGRALTAQCGSLISKVLYVKKGTVKEFVILDAGLTDLIRPALYHAYHKIENLSSEKEIKKYDVVGPVCESSDIFAKDYRLNETVRGDIIAIRSAGAYGEIMASRYNLRNLPRPYTSDELDV